MANGSTDEIVLLVTYGSTIDNSTYTKLAMYKFTLRNGSTFIHEISGKICLL